VSHTGGLAERPSQQPTLLSIDEALELIEANVTPLPAEEVPLEQAYGRYIAEELRAAIDLPPIASSAMDGYALRAADSPGPLTVVGESSAGSPYLGGLGPGEAISISTGAVVPADADAVVPVERVSGAGEHVVELTDAVASGSFVRDRGSDIKRGDLILGAGARLGSAQIGAAAAVGLATVPCRRRPSVAVLTTGTELRQPGEPLAPGEIYNANGPMMTAALLTSGAGVEHIPAAADTVEAHRVALTRALEHDVVISSGGVSVGPHDLVRSVEHELGVSEVFWRIALRPGKPLAFGVRGSTLVFGLPGNPVSSLVCFELFVRPALLALQGAPNVRPAWNSGVLGATVEQNPERDDLIRVRFDDAPPEGSAAAVLLPLHGQQSHQIAITAQADALARIPMGSGELAAGTEVAYLSLLRF
jgi:molybdopterin molybdotransferase